MRLQLSTIYQQEIKNIPKRATFYKLDISDTKIEKVFIKTSLMWFFILPLSLIMKSQLKIQKILQK